jgi:hypothetical protein
MFLLDKNKNSIFRAEKLWFWDFATLFPQVFAAVRFVAAS